MSSEYLVLVPGDNTSQEASRIIKGGLKMKAVEMDTERCKGCGLCAAYCPKGLITASAGLNHHGYHPVQTPDINLCNGCGRCALVCPDLAIVATRR